MLRHSADWYQIYLKVGNMIQVGAGCDLHARGEGERVLALESREGTRASRRVEEGPASGSL